MDEEIDNAEKDVLAEIVKLAQKERMEGTNGGWKEFLKTSDKKFGTNLNDPSKKSAGTLRAFLKTFTKEEDLKFIGKALLWHSNRENVDKLEEKSPDSDSPEQRLVRLTLEHPQYPLAYSFPSHEEGWIVIKILSKSKSMRSNRMIAIDCEMVLCEDGTEALVRVCAVDRHLKVKLNEFVNPNKAIADYRTAITGITAKDLDETTCSLADVQRSMKKLLSHETILVGHSLNNDLKALKLDHARVIDTSFIFKYQDESSFRRPSLNNLCKSVLGYEVRKGGAPHNCLDDVCAAMKLVLAKIEKIERGIDNDILVVSGEVPGSETAKLLLHRIPIHVASEELCSVFSGNFTIERQPIKKAGVATYTAMASFKSLEEAHQAYENVKGVVEKDSCGRPQKIISFKRSTGVTVSICVREIKHSESMDRDSSRKRSFEVEESLPESKKILKMDHRVEVNEKMADDNQSCDHLKEIEKMKETLCIKDHEISALHKIIANLIRKGL